MTRRLFVVVAVLSLTGSAVIAQSKPSIQGVWRIVEVTITNPNPNPGALSKGTHTNLQPALLIFTATHYSTITDTSAKPRPTAPFKDPAKPTAEEMQAAWGPFGANAGTYELVGTTLTRRVLVAKNPAVQGAKTPSRATIKLEGNNLWITTTELSTGKVANPATTKWVRVE